jgi:hypothetical protein
VERRFLQGQHICSVYDSRDEQLRVAVAFISEGLQVGERCLYVASTDADLDAFRALLSSGGVETSVAEASGALLLRTSAEAHLQSGYFDAEQMLGLLNAALEDALNAGYAGLRTCGDMSWLLEEPVGAGHVIEYELLLNPFFQNVRALGMCQYDRSRLPAPLVASAIDAHACALL